MANYLLIIYLLLLSSCVSSHPNTSLSNDIFQLHTGPDGRIYRIESQTGKTFWLDGSTYREVAEPTMPVLGACWRKTL